ncbi:MAG TPA: nicotinate-nucleotide adenylyltransferase [Vicinamibacterales bacterium]|jgi:nicotinate-nucleotide adenylyltransferase
MTLGTRIGILGGTFDPVHLGHIDTALAAQRALDLDLVLVMPSGTPPHRHQQPAASRFHRFAMAALAANGLDRLQVSDLEIGQTEPTYTFDTLARFGGGGTRASQIFFITGADAFAEIETWSRYPQVLDMANFVVISRPGHAASALPAKLPLLASRMTTDRRQERAAAKTTIFLVDAATPDVSSTDIRRRLDAGESITGLVPPAVATYIDQHGLYARAGAQTLGRSLA